MADIPVVCDGQTWGTIPLATLPAFQLFCEEHGIQLHWDPEHVQVELRSRLTGKICALKWREQPPAATSDTYHLEREMLWYIQQALTQAGVRVVFVSSLENIPTTEGALQISVVLEDNVPEPSILLLGQYANEHSSHARMVRRIERELKSVPLPVEMVQADEGTAPVTEIRCRLPANMNPSAHTMWIQRCVAALATGLLRHYLTDAGVSSWVCLKDAFRIVLAGPPLPSDVAGDEPKEKAPPKEKETLSERETDLLDAEVFFDYTVIRSDRTQQPYIIVGHLYIKNTGRDPLLNPIVCLRATPAESVRLSGQIVPEHLVETMGIQSTDGVKGWRLLEPESRSSKQQSGEYWIAPIQPVRIPSRSTHAFQNFQISVQASNTSQLVVIEGFVFFREQQKQVAANNRIALSL